MASYVKVRAKPTITQLNKLKSAAKNKVETILRVRKKNVQDEEMPRELFLTPRQEIKIRYVFANNTSTNIKASKTQMSKITQSRGFLVALLLKLTGSLMKCCVPLATKCLTLLARMASAFAIDSA